MMRAASPVSCRRECWSQFPRLRPHDGDSSPRRAGLAAALQTHEQLARVGTLVPRERSGPVLTCSGLGVPSWANPIGGNQIIGPSRKAMPRALRPVGDAASLAGQLEPAVG